MKTEPNLRDWPSWWSVVLAMPIVIVSLTAIFIAHVDMLGLKTIPLPTSLRFTITDATSDKTLAVRAMHRHRDGRTYVATKYGLFAKDETTLVPVADFAGIEVRGLASAGSTLLVAAKNGVWASQSEGWTRVLPGEAWAVNALPDGSVAAATKHRGLKLSSDDGRTWQVDRALDETLSAPP